LRTPVRPRAAFNENAHRLLEFTDPVDPPFQAEFCTEHRAKESVRDLGIAERRSLRGFAFRDLRIFRLHRRSRKYSGESTKRQGTSDTPSEFNDSLSPLHRAATPKAGGVNGVERRSA
jgi:hypothetical protein